MLSEAGKDQKDTKDLKDPFLSLMSLVSLRSFPGFFYRRGCGSGAWPKLPGISATA